jgi:transcription elongation factor Elf1
MVGRTSLFGTHFSLHKLAEQTSAKHQENGFNSSDKICGFNWKMNLEHLWNKIKYYFSFIFNITAQLREELSL